MTARQGMSLFGYFYDSTLERLTELVPGLPGMIPVDFTFEQFALQKLTWQAWLDVPKSVPPCPANSSEPSDDPSRRDRISRPSDAAARTLYVAGARCLELYELLEMVRCRQPRRDMKPLPRTDPKFGSFAEVIHDPKRTARAGRRLRPRSTFKLIAAASKKKKRKETATPVHLKARTLLFVRG